MRPGTAPRNRSPAGEQPAAAADAVSWQVRAIERGAQRPVIGAKDMDLMQIIEEPEAIVEAIFKFYESRGFVPTRDEREKMLNL